MRNYVRCTTGGSYWFGEAIGEYIHFFTDAPWLGGVPTGVEDRTSQVRLVAPIAPSKIVCVGRNYHAHVQEMGDDAPTTPLIFLKPPSSILEPGGSVVLPAASQRVDFEGELGVVIGSVARRVPRARAEDYVFGYIACCDVTARDLQRVDGQWTRAKGFDSFCPVGPSVSQAVVPAAARLVTRVNGRVRQAAPLTDMIFDIAQVIEFISDVMTLLPGDLILTGTPEGVGPLDAGDQVEVAVDSLPPLRFSVMSEAP